MRLGLLNRSSAAGISDLFNEYFIPSQDELLYGSSRDDFPHGSFPVDAFCAVVNVTEGCNGSCSYYIVRKARGRLKSRRAEDVALKVGKLAAFGTTEVQISTQDTAAYGSDIGTNLGQLLERLVQISGDFMLRLGMMISQ